MHTRGGIADVPSVPTSTRQRRYPVTHPSLTLRVTIDRDTCGLTSIYVKSWEYPRGENDNPKWGIEFTVCSDNAESGRGADSWQILWTDILAISAGSGV